MGITEEDRKRLRGGSGSAAEPEYGRVQDVCDRFGLSRSGLYKLAGEGKIKMVKLASATLVDCGTVRDLLASLPAADIRVGQSRAAA